ncbi:MAG TPA: bifunctional ADP-heptose synthase [Thermoanaerobaculia bacterium]|jgi:rfaE bifunctional protein kinase chain/domain|nr:bifunctional ADP-heptose synthase [Thermoanaerobaculia bacterium]
MSLAVPKERLLALVSSFAGRRLLVAGDYVLDRFVFGHPKRISREAPVLILRFLKEESLPGAAGNTAANVRALGGTPLPVGAVGDDPAGASLTSIFRERGIATDGLIEVPGYHTPTKTRVLAGGAHSIKQQVVRYDQEDHLPEGGDWRGRFSEKLAHAASAADAAVLSDYGYGAISPADVPALRARLRPGAPVLVDSRRGLGRYAGVDAATPNEEELEESAGGSLGDSAEALAAAGDRLRQRIGCRTLLVTLGSRGMALFDGAARPTLIPVHGTDQVADVTGAGDTVLATFSLALASGASPLEAALLANFAGGVVVMKMGTATASADELAQAIASDRTLTA